MTERKRRQNLAKCCNVRFAKLNESTQLRCVESTQRNATQRNATQRNEVFEVAQVAGKNLLIIGSEMWYVFDFS